MGDGAVADAVAADSAAPDVGQPVDAAPLDAAPLDAAAPDSALADSSLPDSAPADSALADIAPDSSALPDLAAQGIVCDPPQTIDNFTMVGGVAQFPAISFSGDRAVAIWGERGGAHEGVALAQYDFSAASWSQPVDIFSKTSPGFTPEYDVAIDADGDITALWREVQGGVYRLWVKIYDAAANTWSPAEQVPGDYQQIHDFALEYDRGTGHPMLAFLTPVKSRTSVYFTKRGAGGWAPPALLESNNADSVRALDLSVNDVGQGLITWVIVVNGTTPTYHVLPYASGDIRRNSSNEPDPLTFVADSEYNLSAWPRTALNNGGAGLLAADDSFGSDREILGVTVDVAAGTLGAPTAFHTGVSPISIGLGQVAMGDSGRGATVWEQTDNFGGPTHPWVSIFDAGKWSTPQKVGTLDIGTNGPKIAVDGAGRVTVVWTSGSAGLIATRNTGAADAFLPQQKLTGSVTSSGSVEVAPHSSGDFLAVWQEYLDVRAMRCR